MRPGGNSGDGCNPVILSSIDKPAVRRVALLLSVGIIFVRLPLLSAEAGSPSEHGVATWHDPGRGSLRTASKRPWIGTELIAAHRTLPLGSKIRVVNLANERSVVVEIRDRGPYLQGRIIDVSRQAAKELGLLETGIAKVRLEAVTDENPSQD